MLGRYICVSAYARKFLETNYKTIKQNNPNLPFLIREAEKTPARLIMRMGTFRG